MTSGETAKRSVYKHKCTRNGVVKREQKQMSHCAGLRRDNRASNA